jgi:antitoxin CptB
MIINIKDLKKKIIYRSKYRGSKEMDNLLGSFTKRYINKLNESELILLSDLIEVDDESLYSFKQGHNTLIKIKENKVSKLFKNFVYESE